MILRLLSNLETATHKLLHILLVGQPELRNLAQKDQRQLNQRVVARFHLLPLDKSDVSNYETIVCIMQGLIALSLKMRP